MPPPPRPDLPTMEFADQAAWRAWLASHHGKSRGVWLKIAKRGTGVTTPSYAEALDEALCQGWIDGQKAALDDKYWLQRFTPRGPRSKWSAVNREHAARLTTGRRMRAAGRKAIEAAKLDGRWEAAYEPPSRATVPDDLKAALDANPTAREFFATLTGANRYAILYRIQDAKRPDTRARRIAQYVEMLAEHRTLH